MVLKKDVDSCPPSNGIKISKSAKCELRFSCLSRQITQPFKLSRKAIILNCFIMSQQLYEMKLAV